MGHTMRAAELRREVGDASGPVIVGAIATATSIAVGLGTLALLMAWCCLAYWRALSKELSTPNHLPSLTTGVAARACRHFCILVPDSLPSGRRYFMVRCVQMMKFDSPKYMHMYAPMCFVCQDWFIEGE